MSDILTIEHVTKRFKVPEGGEIRALDNISLTVGQNEFLTLLGPSGCGKTTLLRAISGFETLNSGEIYIDGEAMGNRPAHLRPVNTVFQKYALFPHLSVERNVAYSLEVQGVSKVEIVSRVAEMLNLVGLGGLGSRKISQLSGGQQQRVALARSLVAYPKILLLDEPLSALDKNLRHKMQQELKALQDELGISFVFVTHDQEEALVMSDRIAVFNNGTLQQLDAPAELYHRPKNEFVAHFIGESNLLPGRVTAVTGDKADITLVDGNKVEVCRAGVVKDESVKILVRPENVHIANNGHSGGHVISGKVEESYFVGSDYKLIVSVRGLPPIKTTMRDSYGTAEKLPGTKVDLFLPHESMHVISAAGGTS